MRGKHNMKIVWQRRPNPKRRGEKGCDKEGVLLGSGF